jgi:hypothetical protein
MPDEACEAWQAEPCVSPLIRTPVEIALHSPAPESSHCTTGACAPTAPTMAWRSIDRSLVDRVRREFFARAAAPAERYGVTPNDVLAHLDQAHLGDAAGAARVLANLEDVAIAVACVRGHPRAWADLWERHESPLIRACHTRLDDADAIVFTRRFWVSLFTSTVTTPATAPANATPPTFPAEGCPSHESMERPVAAIEALAPMGAYVGVRPLRVWLTDRLLGVLEAAVQRAREASPTSRTTVEPASARVKRPTELRWKHEGIVFRAIRRRDRGGRSDIRLRLVD